MLFYCSRWRNAPNRLLETEARLLRREASIPDDFPHIPQPDETIPSGVTGNVTSWTHEEIVKLLRREKDSESEWAFLVQKLSGVGSRIAPKLVDGTFTISNFTTIKQIAEYFINEEKNPTKRSLLGTIFIDSTTNAVKSDYEEAFEYAQKQLAAKLKELVGQKVEPIGPAIAAEIIAGNLDRNDFTTIEQIAEHFLNNEADATKRTNLRELLMNTGANTVKNDYQDAFNRAKAAMEQKLTEDDAVKTQALEARKTALTAEFDVHLEKKETKELRTKEEVFDAFFDALNPTDQQIFIADPALRGSFLTKANAAVVSNFKKMRGADVSREILSSLQKVEKYRHTITSSKVRLGNARPNDPIKAAAWDWIQSIDTMMSNLPIAINAELEKAKTIELWQAGKIAPAAFGPILAGYSGNAGVLGAFNNRVAATPNATLPQWDTLSASQKISMADILSYSDDVITVALADALEEMSTEVKDYITMTEQLGIEKILNELDKTLLEEEKEKKDAEHRGANSSFLNKIMNINQTLGVTWHSPLEIYEACKMYLKAREDAKNERIRRKAARTAMTIGETVGKFSPFKSYHAEVNQSLKANADGDDNKAKSAYIDVLKSGPSKFDDLFGPDGEYHKNQHDYNRTRAIMEYAAEHGWLYRINESRHEVMGVELVAGKNLPPGENVENYIIELKKSHNNGMSSAKKKGSDTAASLGTWPEIQALFELKLREHEYMEAIGVFDKAFGKGKNPATFPKLTIAFIRHMRENAVARAYVNDDVLDALQGLGWGNVMFTPAMLRKDIAFALDRAEAGDTSSMQSSGPLLASIDLLERKIRAEDPSISDKDLDELVSDAFSGKELTGSKNRPVWAHAISIFDDDFATYRYDYADSVRADSISSKSHADYYNNSELILMNGDVFNKVFSIRSTIDFDDKPLASAFAGEVMMKYDNMLALYKQGKLDLSIITNYQAKFIDLFNNYFANTPRAETAAQAHSETTVKGKKEKIFVGMYERGLIARSTLESMANPPANSSKDKNKLALEILALANMDGSKLPS